MPDMAWELNVNWIDLCDFLRSVWLSIDISVFQGLLSVNIKNSSFSLKVISWAHRTKCLIIFLFQSQFIPYLPEQIIQQAKWPLLRAIIGVKMLNRYGCCCRFICGKYLLPAVRNNCVKIWGSNTHFSKSRVGITWSCQLQYNQHFRNIHLSYRKSWWLLNATIKVSSFSLWKCSQFIFIFQLS